jgi:hypothetical protein
VIGKEVPQLIDRNQVIQVEALLEFSSITKFFETHEHLVDLSIGLEEMRLQFEK